MGAGREWLWQGCSSSHSARAVEPQAGYLRTLKGSSHVMCCANVLCLLFHVGSLLIRQVSSRKSINCHTTLRHVFSERYLGAFKKHCYFSQYSQPRVNFMLLLLAPEMWLQVSDSCQVGQGYVWDLCLWHSCPSVRNLQGLSKRRSSSVIT